MFYFKLCTATDPKLVEELMVRLKNVYGTKYDASDIKKSLEGIKKETKHAHHHRLDPSVCKIADIDVKWPTGKTILEVTKAMEEASKSVETALHKNLRCIEYLIYRVNFDDPHFIKADYEKL